MDGTPPPAFDILTKRRWAKDKRSKCLSERPKSRKVRKHMLTLISGLCALYYPPQGTYKVSRLYWFTLCGLCALCGVRKRAYCRTPVFAHLLQYQVSLTGCHVCRKGGRKIPSTHIVCETVVVVRAINQCVLQVRQAVLLGNSWDLRPTDAPLQMISLRVSSPTIDLLASSQ